MFMLCYEQNMMQNQKQSYCNDNNVSEIKYTKQVTYDVQKQVHFITQNTVRSENA